MAATLSVWHCLAWSRAYINNRRWTFTASFFNVQPHPLPSRKRCPPSPHSLWRERWVCCRLWSHMYTAIALVWRAPYWMAQSLTMFHDSESLNCKHKVNTGLKLCLGILSPSLLLIFLFRLFRRDFPSPAVICCRYIEYILFWQSLLFFNTLYCVW